MGSFLDMMEDRCAELQRVGYTNFFVSILIIIGILFSYLLQHYRIISRGTSEGISPYFVLLGVTSANSQFANILALPQSRADVECCKQVSPFECAAGLLGIAQIGVQWICFAVILVLFLVFFRRDDTIPDDDDDEVIDPDQPTWRTAIGVAAACLIHGLVIVIVSGSVALGAPEYLAMWANILGIMSAALAAIQYVPQIWTTYQLKHAGSLSIPMMCVQTPGGFLFAASLGARLGWGGWSSWGVYVLTAVMQAKVDMGMAMESRRLPRPAFNRRTTPRVLPSPGPYSAHLQAYAETQEEIEAALDREAVQGLGENQPLLAPGGIGSSGVR
ncbi:pq loop repeat protein [Apiospora hydei]|uniref:Pq loop repeat protein n=1 Tax=Apiospora hydei TaxID=1337664 RepID=A0ABR1WA47_9PEZI